MQRRRTPSASRRRGRSPTSRTWTQRRVALVNVVSPNFEATDGLPGERVAKAEKREFRQAIGKSTDANVIAWTVIAYPTESWARRVLGEPDLAALWQLIRAAVRLDETDPVAAWEEQITRLKARRDELTERRFDALRYRGPGTDLLVGLLPHSVWCGGDSVTAHGRRFVPNMPTEEVFTTPDCHRTSGTVRATRPVVLRSGTVVEGLELEFSSGRITNVRATSGEDEVNGQVGFDDGAAMLGEVALVDASSRVGQVEKVFFNLLFDENALSHLAWGQAYLAATEGLEGRSDEELKEIGVNRSADAHRLHGRRAGGRGGRDRGRRRRRAAPARQRLAARLSATSENGFVERYLLLGLRLGKLIPGLVDAYYGPPELSARVERESPLDAAALAAEAQVLLAGLEDAIEDDQRARWLRAQLVGLETVGQRAAGEEIDYVDEVERCYGIRPVFVPEEDLVRAHGALDELRALARRGSATSPGRTRTSCRTKYSCRRSSC